MRTSAHPDACLIAHDSDPDDRVIYLLVGSDGEYLVAGWIRAEHAKKQEFYRDPTGKGRHAYFVPQHKLNRERPA